MIDEQWAWLAGLYEGEGSCVTYRRGPRRLLVHITITSTDKDVIERVAEVAGVGRIYGPYFKNGDGGQLGKKPRWRWTVCRTRDVLAVMERIEPFLLSRRTATLVAAREALEAHLQTKVPA